MDASVTGLLLRSRRRSLHGLDGHIIVVGDYRDDRFIFSREVSPALQFTGWRPLWG